MVPSEATDPNRYPGLLNILSIIPSRSCTVLVLAWVPVYYYTGTQALAE